jgi:hypothetical protein
MSKSLGRSAVPKEKESDYFINHPGFYKAYGVSLDSRVLAGLRIEKFLNNTYLYKNNYTYYDY